jgi:hypothetical protein
MILYDMFLKIIKINFKLHYKYSKGSLIYIMQPSSNCKTVAARTENYESENKQFSSNSLHPNEKNIMSNLLPQGLLDELEGKDLEAERNDRILNYYMKEFPKKTSSSSCVTNYSSIQTNHPFIREASSQAFMNFDEMENNLPIIRKEFECLRNTKNQKSKTNMLSKPPFDNFEIRSHRNSQKTKTQSYTKLSENVSPPNYNQNMTPMISHNNAIHYTNPSQQLPIKINSSLFHKNNQCSINNSVYDSKYTYFIYFNSISKL